MLKKLLFSFALLFAFGNNTLACGEYHSVRITKDDYQQVQTKNLVLASEEDGGTFNLFARNASSDFKLGVRLMNAEGEILSDFQLMPRQDMYWERYLLPGSYFLVLYNPDGCFISGVEGSGFIDCQKIDESKDKHVVRESESYLDC